MTAALARIEGPVLYPPRTRHERRILGRVVRIQRTLAWLEAAHTNGDLIATEYLKRLGYFR